MFDLSKIQSRKTKVQGNPKLKIILQQQCLILISSLHLLLHVLNTLIFMHYFKI